MTQFGSGVAREQLYELSAGFKRLADMMIPPTDGRAPQYVELVRSIIRLRRLREDYLGENLFADPAWDMLLELYAARLDGRQVSVSCLCIAAAVPATTALRWISTLEAREIALKRADPKDRRRVFVAITDTAAEKIQAVLAACDTVSTRTIQPLLPAGR
jgi:DNA-binding MarR family transcriptional regulator